MACLDSTAAPFLSVIIPNYNGVATIGACLEALLAADHDDYEVVVVDDGSTDGSVELIRSFPCRLLTQDTRRGASAARNAGAAAARGSFLFFIDADCLVLPDTMTAVERAVREYGAAVVVGGTYTPRAYDPGFFSSFQSTFINHFETKHPDDPDYIASHAMLIAADTFRAGGGFPEAFLPIIEDVEFSHRLRRAGYGLRMDPRILVRHVFNYDLGRSLANAYRKSRYWTLYSLGNRDLMADSGTASRELKINVAAWGVSVLLVLLGLLLWGAGSEPAMSEAGASSPVALLVTALVVQIANLLEQRQLLAAFARSGGPLFAVAAGLYYTLLYPLPVGLGAVRGVLAYLAGEDHGR